MPDRTAADPKVQAPRAALRGTVTQESTVKDPQDFKQAGERIRSLSATDRDHLLQNLANDLKKVKTRAILVKMVANFTKADEEFGRNLAGAVGVEMDQVKQVASKP